jgi:hypothetical protein
MLTGAMHYLKNTEAVMGNRAGWRSGIISIILSGVRLSLLVLQPLLAYCTSPR